MGSLHPSATTTRGQWLALTAALLGWMFDGLEMGLFPLIARPALSDLLGPDRQTHVELWQGIMYAVFLVGAATGGVVFGWLGDRLGRVRAMTLSVLTYSLFMGLCGMSASVEQMFAFRFISALGMGGEWSLGVALVMEVWPNRSRALMAGLIGAAANVGFLLIGLVGLGLGLFISSVHKWLVTIQLPEGAVNHLIQNQGWRLLMMFGALPALLTFFIRLMVPESERWLHAKEKGATSHWSSRDLLGVAVGALGPLLMIYLWANEFPTLKESHGSGAVLALQVVGSIAGLILALVGYTFPVIRYLQRGQQAERGAAVSGGVASSDTTSTLGRMLLGACLSGVALIGTWASLQNAAPWADKLTEDRMAQVAVEQGIDKPRADQELSPEAKQRWEEHTKVAEKARASARSWTQIFSAAGAILGTIAGALAGNAIGRRPTYVILCVGSLVSSLVFFQGNSSYGAMFLVSVFVAGGVTASFYGWLPLYLPELFRTHVRATGQGFSYNFGRILAAVAALQTGYLMKDVFKKDYATACSLMSVVYLVGVIIIWLAPETRGKPLPE